MESFILPLPPDYEREYALEFHRRDRENTAERVSPDSISKGMILGGQSSVLQIDFGDGHASCQLRTSGRTKSATVELAREAAISALGLRIDPAPFARAVKRDKLFAPLLKRRPGLRIIQSGSVFEALTWAIIGQQINLSFAIALRRSFIQLAGKQMADGLWCYPEATDVLQLDADTLGQHKFSRAKAETLLRLARLATEGALDLSRSASVEQIAVELLQVKGIGPWTVNYALLRGYGHPDCSLHGDVAVRTAIQKLCGTPERPSIAEAETWLTRYAPQRTMAAAHLWASLQA